MFRNPSARLLAFVSCLAASFLIAAASDASATGTPGPRATKRAAAGGGASVVVNGVVKDAGQGWPLYAKVDITETNYEATVFTDPVTGYYAVSLPVGATYQFAVTAVTGGYASGGGPLSLPAASATDALIANWTLTAAATCTAPGYATGGFSGTPILLEGFDGGSLPAGWSVDTASGVAWEIYSAGDPCMQFPGNQTGGTGPYAVLNSGCLTTFNFDDSSLVTPTLDLSAVPAPAVQWASDFVDFDFGTVAQVEASIDGGDNWTTIWTAPRPDLPGPGTPMADLSFAGGHPNVRVRFHYQGFAAWWWQVDDVKVGAYACTPLPGGLVVGTVRDANDSAALNGATVSNPPVGGSTVTFATPNDQDHEDGLYILFAESGPQEFAASLATYGPVTKNATVIPGASVLLDFALPAGLFEASPRPLSATVAAGGTQEVTLTMSNTGSGEGSFLIQELNLAPEAPPAAASLTVARSEDRKAALKRVPFAQLNAFGVRLPAPPNAPVNVPQMAQAGNVVGSFPTGLIAGRGLVYDTTAQRLWVPNPHSDDAGIPGDGLEYAYLPDGTQTGDTIDIHETGGLFPVGGTYNARTGMLWQVNVGGDMCLFELDPVAKVVTGKKICGPWSSSQRAVAYDYATDTYYVGGTNEATVYHVDASGFLIDSASIGLPIAGLAYNATTQHLFVATDFPGPFNVWVTDPKASYALVGGFVVTSGGVPVLQNVAASLSADCEGRLWILDPDAQTVYQFESGEPGWCVNDIPWLSEAPATGTVANGATLPVTVTFDSAGLLPGLRLGSLLVSTDTPNAVAPVPVDLTVLFGDVPADSFAASFIYGAAGAGVMPGCAPQAPTFLFCPAEVVTRRTMSGFIERAVHGALTPPPVYLGGFGDVLPGSFNANYIQGLVDDAITAGCGGGNYCPDVPVTRAQMSVFVWKGQHGAEPPPLCTPPGTFSDVACPDGFAVDYIEAIYAEGITVGCGNGEFCPNAGITNAQMAVFLVKAFQIPYLP